MALPAQDQPEQNPWEPIRQDPLGTRLVNVATPFTVGRHALEVYFTHRFNQTVDAGDESNLWGLDSGADIGIGLAWGVTGAFEVSVYRSSFQENFEFAAKYQLIAQAPKVPMSVALRAGANLIELERVEDSTRPFAQLLLARQIVPGLNILFMPSWVRDTPTLHNAWNVPIGLTLPLSRRLLLEVEWIPSNQDFPDSRDAWIVALSSSVGTHIFEITLGNSQATTVDQLLGGDFAGGFEREDMRLGFNLVRVFKH